MQFIGVKPFILSDDAVKFIGDKIKAGHAIKDIKWKGHNISAKTTFSLLAEAERIKKQK